MTARSHHHVPAFYLAGFTLSANRADRLCVWDRKRDKRWRRRPAEIAQQRDFYRVDLVGVEPDAVEKDFARLEAQTAPVLLKIAETRKLPEGEDFDVVLNFVALQATRVPSFRELIERFQSDRAKQIAITALSSPAHFEQFLADMTRQLHNAADPQCRMSDGACV